MILLPLMPEDPVGVAFYIEDEGQIRWRPTRPEVHLRLEDAIWEFLDETPRSEAA